MRAVVLHAAHDLRIDRVTIGAPGQTEVRVRIERGGICGSDLHYFHEGRIGTIVLREPMVLGHEVAGIVEDVGSSVTRTKAGDRVALSPSRPCGLCQYCQRGLQMHCLDMRFYGSAMRMPHIQGAFQQAIIAHESQCHVVPVDLDAGEAALAEPFAVCLHAVNRAGNIFGKRVLVTGCGPIGILAIKAAQLAGAAEIVATDVTPTPFALAQAMGAHRTIDVVSDAASLEPLKANKGAFDCVLECSGNAQAITTALELASPRSIFVQVGLGGAVTLPLNLLVSKEIDLRGTFRFHKEFAQAAQLIGSRTVDLKPLISKTFEFTDAVAAFTLASDRAKSMKVQLAFN